MTNLLLPVKSAALKPIVLMMMAALMINYIDRGNLATAAPLIQDQLRLSSTQLGFLLSAFYWTYVLCMAPVGWAGERFGAHRVLAVGLAIWALATLLTGLVGGFISLLVLRLLLGIGESAAFPCTSQLLSMHVRPDQAGIANGVLGFGYMFGPAIGTVLGGMLMARIGWRPVFVIFGGLSLLWLWPWLKMTANEPKPKAAAGGDRGPSYGQILRQRGLWGAALGHFSSNYNFYFILSWLPVYLVKVRGFSMDAMAGVAGSAYVINALSALAGGWVADHWIRSGRSPTTIYKLLMGMNHVVSIACMAGMVLLPIQQAVACLFVFEVVLGLCSPGVFSIAQIMAGPLATGRWVGIQNACGNLAGIIAPAVTGILIDSTGWTVAFAVCALVNVLGVLGWVVILPRVRPIDWAQQPGSASDARMAASPRL